MTNQLHKDAQFILIMILDPYPTPPPSKKKEEKRKEKEDILKKDFGRHEKKDKHLSLSDYRYFLILKNNILNVMYR